MVELKFRNFVTLLVIGGLIGGAGVVISYDGLANTQIVTSETVVVDNIMNTTSTTYTYKDNSLGESQIFNIWLGAILGYGGAIVAVLYKAKTGSGED
jgi:phosphotransferase system  glucose/maltose/N-acetylglucosamine-specific IIC component